MKIVFIIFFAFLCSNSLYSQQKTPEHYNYPLEENYLPLTIRVNVILLKRKDGSGNFDLKDSEQKEVFEAYLNNINYIYSNLIPPADLTDCYTGSDFIKDTKIQFEFNILEVKNDYYWNYLNSGAIPEEKKYNGFTPYENWYIKPLNDSIFAATDIAKGINAYFTANGEKFDEIVNSKAKVYGVSSHEAAQSPTDSNLRRSSQTHHPNRFLKFILHKYEAPNKYNTTWQKTKTWHINEAKGIGHEFGHSLGLAHSNEHHKSNACKYALMSQKGSDPRNWIPPTEIQKMHWNLTRTNLMQFVTEDSHYGATWKITEDTTWNKPRRFYHDFELTENVTLTISDSIILAPHAKFKLNKNSKIIFQGKGKIVNAIGEEFKNFNLHKKASIRREN